MKILDFIQTVIPEPRKELSKYAPRIAALMIPPDKIGALIGPGGANIRGICEKTGAQIDIDEDDSGRVTIFACTAEAMEAAKREVEAVSQEGRGRQDL